MASSEPFPKLVRRVLNLMPDDLMKKYITYLICLKKIMQKNL